MAIKVLNPGLLTSVQDLGRPGYFHLGIPVSGAMDRYAMRAANLLVGNEESAAGLEAVFVGPQLTRANKERGPCIARAPPGTNLTLPSSRRLRAAGPCCGAARRSTRSSR
ncbi:MAG: hypothetical protein RLO21_06925, partial [Nitratireductor sp.]